MSEGVTASTPRTDRLRSFWIGAAGLDRDPQATVRLLVLLELLPDYARSALSDFNHRSTFWPPQAAIAP